MRIKKGLKFNIILIFLLIGVFLCPENGYSENTLRLQVGAGRTKKRIENTMELSGLLYGLDNPRVKELVTDLMTFGYSQLDIGQDEVEKMVSILHENKDDVTKARQALYDAGFGWTQEGNRYHDVYRNYKANVRYNTTFHLIENYIDEGDVIADIGCGDDKLGIIIVDTIKNTRVIGTDVVDYRDNDYKSHKNVDFVLQTENGKIPLEDNSVDKVIFSAVFHHDTPEMTDKLLKEAKRVLKPNGEVIILEDVVMESIAPKNNEQGLVDRFKALSKEERKTVISIYDWHANHVVVGVTQIPMALNYQTEEEWGQTFARAGFEVKTKDFVGIYKGKVHANPHTVFVLKAMASNDPAIHTIEGLLFKPIRDFKQGQPLDKSLIQPKRNAKEVRDLLEEAKEKRIGLWIEGHLRGIDGPGSSLDLPEFQLSLTKQGARSIEEHPSTPTIASEFKVKIRFELADDPDVIEYIAPDYGITEDKPLRIKGKVELDKYGRTGQAKAPAFIFNNIFGLSGIKIICEEISPIAMAGGMESSNVFNTALLAAASILSGTELNQADIFSLAVKLENDEFGGLTGGQGHICCLLGGAYQHVWLTGEKNEKGELINPYSAISVTLLTDEASLRAIEEHTMLVQAGKRYKDGVAQVGRAASLTNNMWTDLLRDKDEIGLPLHEEKLDATAKFTQALKKGDFKTASEEVAKYTKRRDTITKRWLSLAIDAHNGVEGLPAHAYEYARKVWDENHRDYAEYAMIRDMYSEIGGRLKEISLYTLDPIASLVDEALKEGIAIMPLGAGGPGANLMAMSAKGLSHMKVFFEAQGLKEFDENEARSIIIGTGELKGYMPFKIGREPLKIAGFEELGLRLPEAPQIVETSRKDIGTYLRHKILQRSL